MRAIRLALAFAALVAVAPVYAEPKGFPTSEPIRFVALGDTGTGDPPQYAVAKAMLEVCQQRGCQFAVAVGDNIYEWGAKTPTDPQFQTKFEKPYAALRMPFLMTLGNHDQSGLIPGSGVHPERGENEIQYTRRSERWFMPARYYQFAAPVRDAADYASSVADPVVEFFVLDSNPLAPQNMPVFDWYRAGGKFDLEQRVWLHAALMQSRAVWKIVVTHHPYRNNGKHGNAGEFEGFGLAEGRELKRMFEELICGRVDLAISGHDHSLQWLKAYPPCGTRPQFLISGAGAKTNGPNSSAPNAAEWSAYETLGFFWLEVTRDKLHIAAYTTDANGKPTLRREGDIVKTQK